MVEGWTIRQAALNSVKHLLVTCLFKETVWSFTESLEFDAFLFSRPCNTSNVLHLMLGSQLSPVGLTSPSEPWNKKQKLKSLLTNPSLVDTKPGNSIGLIKLIGLVCPARGLTCQSKMDVGAVTNSRNSFSFPPEAGVRISLTGIHVIWQACASCRCQSIRRVFTMLSHLWSVMHENSSLKRF